MPPHLLRHHPFDRVVISESLVAHGRSLWLLSCFADQKLRLGIAFESTQSIGDLGLSEVFRAVCITRLEIIEGLDGGERPDVDNWAVILHAFNQLDHLTVSGAEMPNHVLEGLGGRTPTNGPTSPTCPTLRYVTLGWEIARPQHILGGCNPARYHDGNIHSHIERRCRSMQHIFEQRAYMGTSKLQSLQFYEYERRACGCQPPGAKDGEEMIASSRRDDGDISCLAHLRRVVGGSVVYLGYLFRILPDYRDALAVHLEHLADI